MCGIAGVALNPGCTPPDLRARMAAMGESLTHRGPDDAGDYLAPDGSAALANRRLAIRDLSPAGHMPMGDAAGANWITYNGEIYNADELRDELKALGYAFRSQSDTEVILHGYAAWGEIVARRLRGMFAFAILTLDPSGARAQKLFLARDPLGIKPLVYAHHGGVFMFGSECRALLQSGWLSAEIDPTALVTYLQLGSVPAPLTIYRKIRALEAGHTLTLTCADGHWRSGTPQAYWRLPASTNTPLAYGDAVAQTRTALLDSVRRHLVSDVPLGVFLSGGIDSAGIVALMRAADPQARIRTCSVVFAERQFDEAWYARQTADTFRTEHVEVRVTAGDLARDLERILQALDQPSNDGANTYFVSRAARQTGLTVALSGLGGDELFGGYPTFQRLDVVRRWTQASRMLPGGRRVHDRVLNLRGPFHPYARLAGQVSNGSARLGEAYLGLRGLLSPSALQQMVRPEVLAAAMQAIDLPAVIEQEAQVAGADPWDAASRLEATCYMRHQLLRDADAMSMAHSLEVRVPFVDHVLWEQILSLPVAARRGHTPKQLLCDAVGNLPAPVRERRGKQGFTFPIGEWLRGPLHAPLCDLIQATTDRLRAFLQPGAGDRILRAFDEGRTSWTRPWAIAALSCIQP